MIDAQRQEILRLLEQLSELAPDVRFGQLIANLSYLAVGPTNEAIWEMEDEQLAVAIRKHIAVLVQQTGHAAAGEAILFEGSIPRARLLPLVPVSPRTAGLHAGALQPATDFDALLPDDFWAGQS